MHRPAQLCSLESLRDGTSAVKAVRTEGESASVPAKTADCNKQHEQKPLHPVSAYSLAHLAAASVQHSALASKALGLQLV